MMLAGAMVHGSTRDHLCVFSHLSIVSGDRRRVPIQREVQGSDQDSSARLSRV